MPLWTASSPQNRGKPLATSRHRPHPETLSFHLMNPRLSDPNNHVPEVSPDDGWGDAEGVAPQVSKTPTVLPPRRTTTDRSSAASVVASESGQTGLRIESNPIRGEIKDVPRRLEVQEIGSSVVRLEQEVPAPPKVARQVTFHERPVREEGEKGTEGEGSGWGHSHRRQTHWLFGAGIMLVTILITAFLMLPSINAPNAARNDPRDGAAGRVIEEKIEVMEAMNLMISKQPEAMRMFASYATATRADEVLSLMRDSRTLEEILRANWQPLGLAKHWSPKADSNWSVSEVDGHPFGVLEGTLPDHGKFVACFTNDDNHLLLDWKATAAYGTTTFNQLEKGGGDPAEIRGEISPADFYSSTWPEDTYQSYRLISPDGEIVIWCYTKRQDAADAAIGPLFNQGEIVKESPSSRKITLRLTRGPEGASPNQWLVGEMLHDGWVTH